MPIADDTTDDPVYEGWEALLAACAAAGNRLSREMPPGTGREWTVALAWSNLPPVSGGYVDVISYGPARGADAKVEGRVPVRKRPGCPSLSLCVARSVSNVRDEGVRPGDGQVPAAFLSADVGPDRLRRAFAEAAP